MWVVFWGLGNNLQLKTLDSVAIKESNNSEAGWLITLCYFINSSPSSISNLVLYWAGNNIMDGVILIQSGINLQWIPTISNLWINLAIATYKEKNTI